MSSPMSSVCEWLHHVCSWYSDYYAPSPKSPSGNRITHDRISPDRPNTHSDGRFMLQRSFLANNFRDIRSEIAGSWKIQCLSKCDHGILFTNLFWKYLSMEMKVEYCRFRMSWLVKSNLLTFNWNVLPHLLYSHNIAFSWSIFSKSFSEVLWEAIVRLMERWRKVKDQNLSYINK